MARLSWSGLHAAWQPNNLFVDWSYLEGAAVVPRLRDMALDRGPGTAADTQPLDDIVGTKRDDYLAGTASADHIDGRQGADTMVGAAGNDIYVVDNVGDQVIEQAGQGRDTVQARVDFALADNVENLTLTGSTAVKGTGNDLANRIEGNGAANVLEGLLGDDKLFGGRGDDSLDGGTGADAMAGGTGNDSFVVDDLGDVTSEREGEGTDTVVATVDWTLAANVENLTLNGGFSSRLHGTGNALANDLHGDFGDNVLDGGDGNDTIEGGYGISPGNADTMWGGAGNDAISSGTGHHSDEIHGGLGNDTINGTGWTYGDDGDDLLTGGLGQYGGLGNDTIQGGRFIEGNEGDDLIDTQQGLTVSGGDGNDTIKGGGGEHSAYEVDAGSGNDLIDLSQTLGLKAQLGDGNDTASVSCISKLELDGGRGRDNISVYVSGGEFDIDGGAGADTIRANGPNGTIIGGEGNDTLTVVNAGWVEGGAGNDTMSILNGFGGLTGGAGNDTFLLAAREDSQNDMFLIQDFMAADDVIAIDQSALPVGDGDTQVEGATVITGPGGFDADAELVIVAEDIFAPLTLDAAAAAIGSANQAYETGQTGVFVVSNGSNTWVLQFESSGNDAVVSAVELSILGRLEGGAKLQIDDVVFTG